MRLSPEQVELIAHRVVRHVDDLGIVKVEAREEVTERVQRALTEDLLVEDRLNDEVREILRGHAEQIDRQNIQYHEMFKLIKAKLVRERKLIL